jgi:hypothetical protein
MYLYHSRPDEALTRSVLRGDAHSENLTVKVNDTIVSLPSGTSVTFVKAVNGTLISRRMLSRNSSTCVMYTYVHVYVHAYTYVHVYVCIYYIYVCIHTCTLILCRNSFT